MENIINEKNIKISQADLVNLLYEKTVNKSIEWECMGNSDESRAMYSKETVYDYYTWKCNINDFIFEIKESNSTLLDNKLVISSINNEAKNFIFSNEIEDVYIINPIEMLIGYLKSKEKEKVVINLSYGNMIDMISKI